MARWENVYDTEPEPGVARRLGEDGGLPFLDFFPWYRKDKADYATAVNLLLPYLEGLNPLIVLSYGNLASSLALKSFTDLSETFFDRAEEDESPDRDPN